MSPMRRRRHFWGDPHRGSAARRPLAEGPLASLRRAHRLMGSGGHAEAAQIFEQLAYGARDIGMDLRAPNLFLQGALAYFLAGNPEAGQKMLLEGLEMLAQGGRWRRLLLAGSRSVNVLKDAGFDEAAQQTQSWLDQKLIGHESPASEDSSMPDVPQRKRLPVTCPSCGAVVRPDEVEWVDPDTAECAYCGSMLAAG